MRHDLAIRLPLSYDGSTVVRGSGLRDPSCSAAIVAIPAHNEAERIGACLASLAVQRDQAGKPVASGTFEVLVFANNCSDETAETARCYAAAVPYRLHVVEDRLPPRSAHAGGARKVAMDRAAELLMAGRRHDGVILTTDADSRAGPLWIAGNLAALAEGVDARSGLHRCGRDGERCARCGFPASRPARGCLPEPRGGTLRLARSATRTTPGRTTGSIPARVSP